MQNPELPYLAATHTPDWRRDALRGFAVWAGLTLYTLVLNHSALAGNWRWDDPSVLLHLYRFSVLDDFIRPEVWQQFSPANLTPWLIFSFEIDLHLFGLNPVYFYGHQLVALAMLAWGLYRCLGLWIAPQFAFLGALLFLSSTPSLLSAQQLMTRHYLEGGVFALASLYLYVRYLRGPRPALLLGGVVCYALAVTAKEVYVPLVVLLPFLPEASIRRRLTAAAPFVIGVLLYAVWRGYMLQSVAGGYVGGAELLDTGFINAVIASYGGFPRLLFGTAWPLVMVLVALLVTTYVSFNPARLLPGILIVLLSLLPLAPLAQFPGIAIADRYLLVVAIALSVFLAVTVEGLARLALERQRQLLAIAVMACAAVVLAATALQGRAVRSAVLVTAREFDSQAEFIWERDAQSAFYPSEGVLPSFWFVTNLGAFKAGILGGATAPVAIVDAIYLTADFAVVYAYDGDCRCMQESATPVAGVLAAQQQRLREDAALSLEFSYESGYFTWEFGPYSDGEYRVVSDVLGVIPAPRTGRLRVSIEEDTPFYLRYTHPDGWMTYSPLQRIHQNAPTTRWRRD